MGDVVQRWRVVYSRGPLARGLGQREEIEAWEAAVLAAGLPAVGVETGRPRLTFALPLPLGLDADEERFDLPLSERRTRSQVRSALAPARPVGHALVDVHDVWVGEPSLTGRVVAADYRLELAEGVDARTVADAANRLLAAGTLPRVRRRGERETAYDLRPLIVGILVETDAEGPAATSSATDGSGVAERATEGRVTMRTRLRVDPSLGTGRPDEVLAAIAEAAGLPVEMIAGRRERIWLADETPMGP